MAEQTQPVVRSKAATKPERMWVEFITSQAGFHMKKMEDGSTQRGAMFNYQRGDKVEKETQEAETLIAAGTCKACKPPAEVVAAAA